MYYIDKSLHIISIHALRKECDYFYADNVIWVQISIHALRKECDFSETLYPTYSQISIHALRKECDLCGDKDTPILVIFLSTHSVRSATKNNNNIPDILEDFYPRTP